MVTLFLSRERQYEMTILVTWLKMTLSLVPRNGVPSLFSTGV